MKQEERHYNTLRTSIIFGGVAPDPEASASSAYNADFHDGRFQTPYQSEVELQLGCGRTSDFVGYHAEFHGLFSTELSARNTTRSEHGRRTLLYACNEATRSEHGGRTLLYA